MCTLHLFYRVFPSAPVLFAANRDENLDRSWREPARLSSDPPVFGPRDGSAGGTWLGLGASGLLVSLANHFGTLGSGQSLCSRGFFVAEVLRRKTAREAARFAAEAAPRCKAFTLLLADPDEAYVVDSSPRGFARHRLGAGTHVITNAPFGDPGDAKAARSRRRMAALGEGEPPSLQDLAAFLSDHEPAAPETTSLCVHPKDGDRFGTSSASVVQLGAEGEVQRFLFCAGPPCSGSWSDRTEECRSSLRDELLAPLPRLSGALSPNR
ncbi:MAG: NRDE family protein [Deltaproteobacteria bacterium]|nr:NRDE family protein [Deltaproteobacteria bacterium]